MITINFADRLLDRFAIRKLASKDQPDLAVIGTTVAMPDAIDKFALIFKLAIVIIFPAGSLWR